MAGISDTSAAIREVVAGFTAHTLLVCALACLFIAVPTAQAQVIDSTRVTKTTDTTVAPVIIKAPAAPRIPSRLSPPLSPKRAFIYSALLPGLGQSKLDRGTSGALFASVEMAAITMVRRSRSDLHEVRRYRTDSLPEDFTTNGTTLVRNGAFSNRYTEALEKTRQLHVEDWLAVIAFNHLFAGADAFVAAQLWDNPVTLTAIPHINGAMFVATLKW